MQRLKAYIRRTVTESAREYADGKRRTAESTKAAFMDAMHGTDTGWWNDLIYTTDVLRLANYYRNDIAAAVRDYCEETGVPVHDTCGTEHSFADVMYASTRRYTWEDYTGDNGHYKQRDADALTWGLRFAVEYLCGQVASEMGVEV